MALPPPPPIARNLTSMFVRYRQNRRGGVKKSIADPNHRLLDREMSSPKRPGGDLETGGGTGAMLPPAWTDSADEAREELKSIKEKLVQLAKTQQKRLLKVFADESAPDQEVESVSNQISSNIRRCEQAIHQVKVRGAATACQQDGPIRENVQRNLATQLQTLSQQFRQAQKDYMAEIRKRQRGGIWDEGPKGSKGGDRVEVGFTDDQLQELETMEVNADQRNAEISQIAHSIGDLHTIFKELAVLVIDQGSILDRIDFNIEQVVDQSIEANKQLQKAEKTQKSARAMKCILFLVMINLMLIGILVAKTRT